MKYAEVIKNISGSSTDLAEAIKAAKLFGLTPRDKLFPKLKHAEGDIVKVSDATFKKWEDRGLCKLADPKDHALA